MRYLIALLFIGILGSCSYEKRLKKWCSRCPQKDSVSVVKKDSIIYRDSAVFFTLAGDTINIPTPCPEVKPFEIKKNKGGLVTTIKSDGKTITANCEADSLRLEIKRIKEIHFHSVSQFKSKVIQEYCKREHRTGWNKFCTWWTVITWIFITLYVAWRTRKLWLK